MDDAEGAQRTTGVEEKRPVRPLVGGACLVLVGLVVGTFWPALEGGYVWDDRHNFVTNPMWRGLEGEKVRWMLTAFHAGHYQPATWLSMALQHELLGGEPVHTHAVNIALHALNTVLLFLVIRRVLARLGSVESGLTVLASAAGAAFWGVHPLRVESVAWATERRDLLSTVFLLSALLAYLRAATPGEARVRSWGWYAGAVLLAFLSCASKAWGMSFFVVLMALDMYPLRRVWGLRGWFSRNGARVALEKLPFAVIGAATAVMASRAQEAMGAAKPLAEWGITERLVQSFYGLYFYVEQTVLPSGHSPLYELPGEVHVLEARYVVAYLVVGALVFAGVWLGRRMPGLRVALFTYVVLVSPVLGVLQSGDQFVADRYSYLAVMPFAVGLAWILGWGARGYGQGGAPETPGRGVRSAGLGAALVIAALAFGSNVQSRVWRNEATLWAHAAGVTPTPAVLWNHGMQVKGEDPALAAGLFRRAAEGNPRFGAAWYEYGKLMQASGDVREAERAYQEAAPAMKQAYLPLSELGLLYYATGRHDDALRCLRAAVESVERSGDASRQGRPFMAMGLALADLGRRAEAAEYFRKALADEDTREAAGVELRRLGAG